MTLTGTTNPVDPAVLALIRSWSRFLPKGGDRPVDMGQRTLDQISPGWVATIHRRSQKALKEHLKAKGETLPLCLPDVGPTVKRRPRVRRFVPEASYDEAVSGERRMPKETEENHPEDLPF